MPAFAPIASEPIAWAPPYSPYQPTDVARVFPSLIGEGWPIVRTIMWQSRKPVARSGKEDATQDFPYPFYTWKLVFNVLRQGVVDGITQNEMVQLFDFYDACGGGRAAFVYRDQDDNAVTNQPIARADGTTKIFPFVRTFAGFAEPILAPNYLTPPQIFLDGVQASADTYSITSIGTSNILGPGYLIFVTAPANNVLITATFSYYWPCRFVKDSCSFEKFLSGRYRVGEISFKSFQ